MIENPIGKCIKMEEGAIQEHVEQINNNGNLWIDIEKPTRNKMEILGRKFPFNELNLEDCLSKIQITKIDRYEDHIFIILHFPTSHKEKGKPRFSQLSIFAGMNYLITVHQGDLKPLIEMFQVCKKSPDQRQALMGRSSGYLLHSIIDVLVDDLLHILMKVVGNLDDIEDAVFDDKIAVAKEISLLRREITTLRRVVIPLKRIVLEITKSIQKFSEEDLTLYFDDVKDHIDKVLEALEESKETIEIYKDTDFMLSTEKTNKILAVLTILFTLSIPATVIGAFYGMNVNLPGGIETGSWTFFGMYTTLIVIVIISTIPALLMIWYFRRLGWIGVS
jgi:magnesium transporter